MPFDQTKPSDAWSRHFRYRGERGREQTIGDSFRRVADALAGPEREDERDAWSRRFLGALTGFYFVPSEQVRL